MKNTKILKSISLFLLLVFSITLSFDVVFATKKEETSIDIKIHDGGNQKQIGDNMETVVIETNQEEVIVVKSEKEMRRINGLHELAKHPLKLAFSTVGGFMAGFIVSACTFFTFPWWLATLGGATIGLLSSGISSYCKGYNL